MVSNHSTYGRRRTNLFRPLLGAVFGGINNTVCGGFNPRLLHSRLHTRRDVPCCT